MEKALAMLQRRGTPADRRRRRHHQCRCLRPAGRVRRAHRRAGDPDADGLGRDPRRPPADGRHGRACRPATATAMPRCLRRDFVLGIGNRWANRHTGSVETSTRRAASSCTSTSSRRRSAACSSPDYGIVSDARAALELFCRRGTRAGRPQAGSRTAPPGSDACRERKRTMLRRTHFDNAPIKPQRVYEEMNKAFAARHHAT